jgi:hypothetical protein
MKHAISAIVAVAVVVLSLADGAYAPEAFAAATIVVWWAVVLVALSPAGPRGAWSAPAIAAAGGLGGLALLSLLSLGWADDNGRAFADAVRMAGYAGLLVLVVIASDREGAAAWLRGLAIGLGAVVGLAILMRLYPGLPGAEGQIAEALPEAKARLSQPIGYWNGIAALAALTAVLLTWFGAFAGSRLGRAAAVAVLPLCALTVYMASSRGGVAAGAVGLVALFALSPSRARLLAGLALGGAGGGVLIAVASGRDELLDGVGGELAEQQADGLLLVAIAVTLAVAAARWALDRPLSELEVPRVAGRVAIGAALLALGAGLIAADPSRRLDEFNDPPSERIEGEGYVASHLSSTSGSGRWQFWGSAMDAFQEEPVLGVGAGGYEGWWSENGRLVTPLRDAHSLFLETLGELGVAGGLLLVLFLGSGLFAGARAVTGPETRAEAAAGLALIATGATSAAIDWTWELPAVFAPVVLAVALLAGPIWNRREHGEQAEPGGASSSRLARLGVAAAGLVAVILAAIVFLSELRLDASRDAVRAGDLGGAEQAAGDAAALEPWNAAGHAQVALVAELRGDLPAARDKAARAIEESPGDWRLWVIAARLETKAGDVDAARRSLERARTLTRGLPPPPPVQP